MIRKNYNKPNIKVFNIKSSDLLAGSCDHNKCNATDEGKNCECGIGCTCHEHNKQEDIWDY